MLLDSHVLLWWLEDDPRLGEVARRDIGESVRALFSAASIWELVLKMRRGALEIPDTFETELRRNGLDELPVTSAHARTMLEFPQLRHHDPFDTLLVAQAHAERLTFLTADRLLLGLGLPFIRDARS